MSAQNKTYLCLGAVLLLGLGTLWYGQYLSRKTERSLLEVNDQREALAASMAKVRARIAAHKRDIAFFESPKDVPGKSADPFSNPASSVSVRPNQSLASLLESNPGLKDLYLKSFRANLDDRWALIYQKLGLSSDQISRVESLAVEHEQEVMDLRVAAAAQGLPMGDAGISALRRQADGQYEASLTATIGEAASRQITQAPGIPPPLQGILSNIAEVAALGPGPMTYARMAEVTPDLTESFSSLPSDESDAIAWNRQLARGGGSLSPAQREILQSMASLNVVNGLVRQYYTQQTQTKVSR